MHIRQFYETNTLRSSCVGSKLENGLSELTALKQYYTMSQVFNKLKLRNVFVALLNITDSLFHTSFYNKTKESLSKVHVYNTNLTININHFVKVHVMLDCSYSLLSFVSDTFTRTQ